MPPICDICDFAVESVTRCNSGEDCEISACILCLLPSGECPDCAAEAAKGIWRRRTKLRAVPPWPVSGEPADECRHLEGDEAQP